MKILAVATLILWIGVEVLAMDPKEIEAAMDGCIKETKVDEKLVQQALLGNVSDDPALKKHIACVFNKLQVMNGTEMDKDKLKELLKVIAPTQDDDVLQQVIDICADKPGETPEDKAVAVYKCSFNPQ